MPRRSPPTPYEGRQGRDGAVWPVGFTAARHWLPNQPGQGEARWSLHLDGLVAAFTNGDTPIGGRPRRCNKEHAGPVALGTAGGIARLTFLERHCIDLSLIRSMGQVAYRGASGFLPASADPPDRPPILRRGLAR